MGPFPAAPCDGAHYGRRRRPAHRKVRQKKIIPVNFFLNHYNELGKLLAALSPSRPRKLLRLSRRDRPFASREPAARAPLRLSRRFLACKQRPWNPIGPKNIQKQPACNTSFPFPQVTYYQSQQNHSPRCQGRAFQARKRLRPGNPRRRDGAAPYCRQHAETKRKGPTRTRTLSC